MRPRVFWSVLFLVVVAGGALGLWQAVTHYYNASGPSDHETTVVIPKGSNVKQVATVLSKAGVIRNKRGFRLLAWIYRADRQLKAGEYAIPAEASIRAVTAILRSGDTILHQVTVPEGLTSTEVLNILNNAYGLLDKVTTVPPEGTLLPETYSYTYGDSVAEMIRRMSRAMDREINMLWQGRDPDLPFHSPDEAVTLASLVEKETAVPAERSRIAGVFINRLRKHMRLQSDPTVVYAIDQDGALGRPLTRQDLDVSSPYNTYEVYGLPPGPIANPGKDALYAALHPLTTDELYFVADGTGGHTFAKTLDEHNANVRKWRRLRSGR